MFLLVVLVSALIMLFFDLVCFLCFSPVFFVSSPPPPRLLSFPPSRGREGDKEVAVVSGVWGTGVVVGGGGVEKSSVRVDFERTNSAVS